MKTPELRFREFRGKDDWETKKLEDISNVYQPKTISISDCVDTGYDVFGANGFIGKYKEFNHELAQVTVSCRGENSGVVNYVPEKCWITGNSMVINVDDNDSIIKDYLNYCLSSYNLKKLVTGSGQPQIVKNVLDKFKISLPSLPEQQKIGSFFSLLDNKTELQEKKIGKLELAKKGLMQRIFDREIRFKRDDGGDYPEWEEKKLGEIFNILVGGDVPQNEFSTRETMEHTIPIYSNSLENKGLYGYTNIVRISSNESITVTGRGDIGNAVYRNESFYPIVRLLVCIPLNNDVYVKFFEYAINNINILPEFTGVPQLTAPQLALYEVAYPSYFEQQKIANILSCYDSKIEKERDKLEKMKGIKKGLMQGMFV